MSRGLSGVPLGGNLKVPSHEPAGATVRGHESACIASATSLNLHNKTLHGGRTARRRHRRRRRSTIVVEAADTRGAAAAIR